MNQLFGKTRADALRTRLADLPKHERCEDNCSCDCHLQGHSIPAAMRLTTPQEIRFERPVERREATERPRVQPLSGTTQRPSHSFAESLRSCAPGQPIRTGAPGSKKRFLYKIFFERVRSCTTLVRYRKSTLGLGYTRSSQRAKCSASRSGGETNFLHLGQTTASCLKRLSFLTPARCFFISRG